jgi:hypothetical protein
VGKESRGVRGVELPALKVSANQKHLDFSSVFVLFYTTSQVTTKVAQSATSSVAILESLSCILIFFLGWQLISRV